MLSLGKLRVGRVLNVLPDLQRNDVPLFSGWHSNLGNAQTFGGHIRQLFNALLESGW
jgi:hypothetical protein